MQQVLSPIYCWLSEEKTKDIIDIIADNIRKDGQFQLLQLGTLTPGLGSSEEVHDSFLFVLETSSPLGERTGSVYDKVRPVNVREPQGPAVHV